MAALSVQQLDLVMPVGANAQYESRQNSQRA